MKILITIPCLLKGGTEIQTLNLVRVLICKGYTITTLCYFEFDDSMVQQFKQAGCNVILLKWNRNISPIQFILRLRKGIKIIKPDVIHVQYMAPGALPIIAAKLAGIKQVLATVHQPYTSSHGKPAKLLLRFSALLCTRFICVSKNAEISWFGTGSLYNETIPLQKQPKHFTIYNAVDVDRIQQILAQTDIHQQKKELGIESEKFLIGAVSRLRYEKGIDLLIEAFAMAIKEIPDMHLLIVGSGPDEEKLRALAEKQGITKRCTFYGGVSWEIAMQQMALMDVVAVPSRFEGFGLTAAEAMAMGKPVVASAVFGLQEVVTDGKTGLLFSSENRDEFVGCLKRLYTDKIFSERLGVEALIHVKQIFDYRSYHKKIMYLYDNLFNFCK